MSEPRRFRILNVDLELHGGTVSAESAGAGQGATFVVRLPLTLP